MCIRDSRTLSLKGLQLAIGETLRTSAMVVLLITGAVLFGKFLTGTRLPFDLAEWATGLPIPPIGILGVVLFIYLIGGCLMDALGFLVATIPIFFPLAVACLLYTSPSPRDRTRSRMPSS